jgi:hypothetical protein
VKILGTKVLLILGGSYTEGTETYCDYLISCVSCNSGCFVLKCVGECMGAGIAQSV